MQAAGAVTGYEVALMASHLQHCCCYLLERGSDLALTASAAAAPDDVPASRVRGYGGRRMEAHRRLLLAAVVMVEARRLH